MADFCTMIKYNTKLRLKHLNMEARILREIYAPLLKGMQCRKHSEPTIIQFYEFRWGNDSLGGSFVSSRIRLVVQISKNVLKTR